MNTWIAQKTVDAENLHFILVNECYSDNDEPFTLFVHTNHYSSKRTEQTRAFFHTQEEAPGMVFWHEKGWNIYLEIQNYIREKLRAHGYQEVHTPQVIDRSLWEKSGH